MSASRPVRTAGRGSGPATTMLPEEFAWIAPVFERLYSPEWVMLCPAERQQRLRDACSAAAVESEMSRGDFREWDPSTWERACRWLEEAFEDGRAFPANRAKDRSVG